MFFSVCFPWAVCKWMVFYNWRCLRIWKIWYFLAGVQHPLGPSCPLSCSLTPCWFYSLSRTPAAAWYHSQSIACRFTLCNCSKFGLQRIKVATNCRWILAFEVPLSYFTYLYTMWIARIRTGYFYREYKITFSPAVLWLLASVVDWGGKIIISVLIISTRSFPPLLRSPF